MTGKIRKNGTAETGGELDSCLWRFVDYEGRFAPTNMPQGREVAQYAKWYLNAWKGPGAEVLVAVNQLRAEKDFIWYQGAIVELLTVAMNQSPESQGSLVTRSDVPMTASKVGLILRVSSARALAVLTRLEQVGILERVDGPPRDSGGEIQDAKCSKQTPKLPKQSKMSRRGSGAAKGGAKRGFQARKRGPPFQESEKSRRLAAQAKIEGRSAVPASDETPPACADGPKEKAGQGPPRLTCPQCGHVGKVRKAAKGWGAKAVQCTKCGHVTTRAEAEAPTPRSSTSPDGGEGPGKQAAAASAAVADPGRKALPAPDFPAGPNVMRMGDILAGQGHRYSVEANAFGDQVCAAAGYVTCDRGEYVNEMAHWAKLWDQACGELSEIGMARLRAKVLRIADRIRSGRQGCDVPQAYLERTMQNEIRDQIRAHRVRVG